MSFNPHSDLIGRHAFLSASNYHWINYDSEKLDEVFRNSQMARRGTELHELAFRLIRLGIKLPNSRQTLNMYVNDAIGFRMEPEQILYYSDNAYGTTDAIAFRKNVLRVHDLKTGVNNSSMHQLEVYTALFCLEYAVKPGDIKIELRIYQNDEVEVYVPEVEDIIAIMSKIVVFDRRIDILKTEG